MGSGQSRQPEGGSGKGDGSIISTLKEAAWHSHLKPVYPDIGRPYHEALSKLQPLALLVDKSPREGASSSPEFDSEDCSNSLHWWRCRESNPGPKIIHRRLLHACSGI